MTKNSDMATIAKLESSPNGEPGGENSNVRRWKNLLRLFFGRRRVKDNLRGMHPMRPYDQGRRYKVSQVRTRSNRKQRR